MACMQDPQFSGVSSSVEAHTPNIGTGAAEQFLCCWSANHLYIIYLADLCKYDTQTSTLAYPIVIVGRRLLKIPIQFIPRNLVVEWRRRYHQHRAAVVSCLHLPLLARSLCSLPSVCLRLVPEHQNCLLLRVCKGGWRRNPYITISSCWGFEGAKECGYTYIWTCGIILIHKAPGCA